MSDNQPYADNPDDPAVELIRSKIASIYAEEPGTAQESVQAEMHSRPGSNHQQYMQQLHGSGMSLTDIQAAWHNYYVSLPDAEKYQVWQEFYVTQGVQSGYQQIAAAASDSQPAAPVPASIPVPKRPRTAFQKQAAMDQIDQAAAKLKSAVSPENLANIKSRIRGNAQSAGARGSGPKLQKKHHLQSLAFGLGCGLVVVVIFMFGFFNEFLIAPFIQPSRRINDTPVIVDAASTVVSGGPKVIIPKINVEIPTDYSQTTTDEKQIELALDNGVVHYPTTVKPGEVGNGVYFGHSSNNIFNPGKYKFAFVLLHELTEGDTFYLTKDGKTYAYRVFSRRVVEPSEVSVLGPVAGHPATATLITCDPPGTSLKRLVVVGDQISPDPSGNTVPGSNPNIPAPVVATAGQGALPGNGPTLWARIWGTIF